MATATVPKELEDAVNAFRKLQQGAPSVPRVFFWLPVTEPSLAGARATEAAQLLDQKRQFGSRMNENELVKQVRTLARQSLCARAIVDPF